MKKITLDNEFKNISGQDVRGLREYFGLTQNELGESLSVDGSTVSRVEGKNTVPSEFVQKMIDVFKTEYEELSNEPDFLDLLAELTEESPNDNSEVRPAKKSERGIESQIGSAIGLYASDVLNSSQRTQQKIIDESLLREKQATAELDKMKNQFREMQNENDRMQILIQQGENAKRENKTLSDKFHSMMDEKSELYNAIENKNFQQELLLRDIREFVRQREEKITREFKDDIRQMGDKFQNVINEITTNISNQQPSETVQLISSIAPHFDKLGGLFSSFKQQNTQQQFGLGNIPKPVSQLNNQQSEALLLLIASYKSQGKSSDEIAYNINNAGIAKIDVHEVNQIIEFILQNQLQNAGKDARPVSEQVFNVQSNANANNI